ncbi:MAG: 4-(cytidine 5'-diphospho)-2-C-methyl-D-erythritol kinase [Solirubrobacterales bacterium]|nr:4-(cytidine 5'-diphospho)-2-C-methyl-D-erythritol kinase [Solirubrobacterales bacterium]
MILQARAKVNLCLYLGEQRASDGRHQLVTVFQALSLADRLSVVESDVDQVICPGVDGRNLAADALALLRSAGWDSPPLAITIDKAIPVAAGMGGGSADAAAVLSLARDQVDVFDIAAELGADVSALIEPGLWLGTGVGEELASFPAGLAEHAYVILPAGFGLSTADVYREADRLELGRPAAELAELEQLVRRGLADGGRFPPLLAVNDLAPAALSLAPEIQVGLEALYDAGAEQAMVSGSGPTVFGVWWGGDARAAANGAAETLSKRFPGALSALPFPGSSQLS